MDDDDIDTGDSVGCVMTLGEIVGCVAGSGKELGGDEGGLIGRAGGGWRLVVGEAEQLRELGRGWVDRDCCWLVNRQEGMWWLRGMGVGVGDEDGGDVEREDEEDEEEEEAECAMGWWWAWPWHGGGSCGWDGSDGGGVGGEGGGWE